jgi:hypothetical protein
MIKSMPTIEGAGVYLRRAFGFGNPKNSIRFFSLTISPAATASIVGNLPASKH